MYNVAQKKINDPSMVYALPAHTVVQPTPHLGEGIPNNLPQKMMYGLDCLRRNQLIKPDRISSLTSQSQIFASSEHRETATRPDKMEDRVGGCMYAECIA
jgi:hypothetical protein